MKQERTYMMIGVFVFGALVISLFGGIYFYHYFLHGRVENYVMFFNGSLNGLDTNSPVTYRGVKIGEVRHIELTIEKSNVTIPVYVEFFVEKSFVPKGNPIHILIQKGYVATISSPNLLTGKSGIKLVPGERRKPIKIPPEKFKGYAKFPTKTIGEQEEITVNEALRTAKKTLEDISRFFNSKEFEEMIAAIRTMADSIDSLAHRLDQEIPGSLVYFNNTLSQISKAAYSTSNLTDYLFRHPEALLRGRS